MENFQWADSLQAAVTVCNRDGIIVYMNQSSRDVFANRGGGKLIGQPLAGCHSTASNQKIQEMLSKGSENIYTIEKHGRKKMILQTPFFENGLVAGLVEISFEIPVDMPHFIRG